MPSVLPIMLRKKQNSDIRKIGQMCLQIFGTDDKETKTVFIEAFSELFREMNRMKTFQNPQLSRKQRLQILKKTLDILEDYKEEISTKSWMNASNFFLDHYKRINYKYIL